MVKRFLLIPMVSLVSLLSSCTTYPRLLNFPFDASGRSLNSPSDDITPQISGRFITFVSDRQGRQDVYLFDGNNRRLVDIPGLNQLDILASHPGISEDGRYIVFAGTRQGQSNIYLHDRETRQLRNLTENFKAEVRNPVISADGSTIAFESSANGQWDLMILNARSGQPLDIPIAPR